MTAVTQRRVRETAKRREAYECYLNLGSNRSLRRLREKLLEENGSAPSERTLSEWSRRLAWQARIDLVEKKAGTDAEEEYIASKREVNRRHAEEGMLLQEWAVERILAMDPDDVTLAGAIRAYDLGNRIERAACGVDREVDAPDVTVVQEIVTVMGGPKELFMFPDPDQALEEEF